MFPNQTSVRTTFKKDTPLSKLLDSAYAIPVAA